MNDNTIVGGTAAGGGLLLIGSGIYIRKKKIKFAEELYSKLTQVNNELHNVPSNLQKIINTSNSRKFIKSNADPNNYKKLINENIDKFKLVEEVDKFVDYNKKWLPNVLFNQIQNQRARLLINEKNIYKNIISAGDYLTGYDKNKIDEFKEYINEPKFINAENYITKNIEIPPYERQVRIEGRYSVTDPSLFGNSSVPNLSTDRLFSKQSERLKPGISYGSITTEKKVLTHF